MVDIAGGSRAHGAGEYRTTHADNAAINGVSDMLEKEAVLYLKPAHSGLQLPRLSISRALATR